MIEEYVDHFLVHSNNLCGGENKPWVARVGVDQTTIIETT